MYKSFAITIRPKNGISPGGTLENNIIKKLKNYDYCSVFAEMENEARHIHCQIWLNKPCAIGTIKTAMVRIQERYDPDWGESAKKVLRGGIKIAYSDWILDYCEENDLKEDDPNCLFHRVPPMTSEFYATEEEQQKIIDSSKSANKTYFKLRQDLMENPIYEQWRPNVTKDPKQEKYWIMIGNYLSYRMYVEDTYPIIKCPKLMNQFIKAFTKYVTKDGTCTEFLTKHDYELIYNEEENLNK